MLISKVLSAFRSKYGRLVLMTMLSLVLITMATGCGGSKGPSKKVIKEALVEYGANVFVIDGAKETFDIKKVKILRQKTEDGYDESHVSIECENDGYTVTAELVLYSSYYDDGGWVIDYCEEVSYHSVATKSTLDIDMVTDTCSRNFTTFDILDQKSSMVDGDKYTDVVYFQTTIESVYVTEIFEGTYTRQFVDNRWVETWDISPTAYDWSRLLGPWKLTHYGEYIELKITDVSVDDSKKITIAYEYSTSPWEGYFGEKKGGSAIENKSEVVSAKLDYTSNELRRGATYSSLDELGFVGFSLHIGGASDDEGGTLWMFIGADEGLGISEFKYLYKDPEIKNSWEWMYTTRVAFLNKQFDYDAVQDAIDRLKDKNKGN